MDDDDSINFDADPEFAHLPPLDKRRKIRREVLRTINEIRSKFKNGNIFIDPLASQAADEYAQFLLDHEAQEETFRAAAEKKLAVLGEAHKVLVGHAGLEEDQEPQDKYMMEEFMDAHGLLLELQEELGLLTHKDFTHIGVGFAQNTREVKVVEVLTQKACMVQKLSQSEEGAVEVSGLILNTSVGLYAARIANTANLKKDVAIVGPHYFAIDKEAGTFSVQFKGPHEGLFYSGHVLELYIRKAQVDKIKYGAEADANERIKADQLTLALRLPLEYIPDPRTVIEDEADRLRFERDLADRAKRAEEERLIRIAERLARKEERERKKEEALAARERGDVDEDMSGSEAESGSKRQSQSGADGENQSQMQSAGGDASDQFEDEDEMGEHGDEELDAANDLPSPPQMKLELI